MKREAILRVTDRSADIPVRPWNSCTPLPSRREWSRSGSALPARGTGCAIGSGLLTLLWLFSPFGCLAQPVQVVVPGGLAGVEGNTSVNDFLNSPIFRMQMVFDASQFTGLGGGPGISNAISSIWFRIDGASTFDVDYLFGGASVTLSTTLRSPDNLSPVFAENIGPDALTVYNQALGFGGTYQPGADPQAFALNILPTRAFYYSPSEGNLLMDIVAGGRQQLLPGALDAQFATGDSVSRVFAASEVALSGTADSLGLVTRFNITVIPEPSTFILVLAGLLLGYILIRPRRRVLDLQQRKA